MTLKQNGNHCWPKAKLGEVIELFDSQRIPLNSREREQRRGEYPYYGAQGIIDHIDGYLFDGRYILVAEDGENLNSKKLPLALFANGKFWVNNHAHILRGKPGIIDDTFLLACLNNADIKPFVTGAAQPKLSQANLRLVEVPFPPFPIQEQVAGVLSAYDHLIKNNTRRIQVLERMAQALYRQWFVNFRFPGHAKLKLVDSPIGPIPQDWNVVRLDELYPTASGGTPSRKKLEYYGGETNWVKTQELRDCYIFETDEKISIAGLENSSTKIFPANTVLVAMYGATIGQLGILAQPAATNQACCALLSKLPGFNHGYAYLTLLTRRSDLVNLRQGAAQQNVSQIVIRGFPMLKPPSEVMAAFNENVEPKLDLIRNLQRKNQVLHHSRDLLLPRLLSGQVDVSRFTDE
jgi:type I restriction enzyme S subunit